MKKEYVVAAGIVLVGFAACYIYFKHKYGEDKVDLTETKEIENETAGEVEFFEEPDILVVEKNEENFLQLSARYRNDYISIIDPSEFGEKAEEGYLTQTLFSYIDGAVSDEHRMIFDNANDLINCESPDFIDEIDANGVVFVRNEYLKTDFEVILVNEEYGALM